MLREFLFNFVFFFIATATTEIYTLSLHDALPISATASGGSARSSPGGRSTPSRTSGSPRSESTRLNSSHGSISYAVFCLKKKKKNYTNLYLTKKKTNKSH